MPDYHESFGALIEAIQAEDFDLAKSLSQVCGYPASREAAVDAIHDLGRALELARVVRAHLAVRAISNARESAYQSALCVPGRWALEA